MTVKELKNKLEGVDETMFVYIVQTNDEYENSLVNKVEVSDISFTDGKLSATDTALVITDEI